MYFKGRIEPHTIENYYSHSYLHLINHVGFIFIIKFDLSIHCL